MLSTKIIQLLSSLTPKEFKEFSRFLNSPFFNTNPRIIALYQQLKKYYPTFDSPKLEKEKLYKKIFPTKAYHYQQMANLLSELTRLTEGYLIQLTLKQQPFQQQKMLIESYQERSILKSFEKNTLNLLTELATNQKEDKQLHSYLLRKQYFFHPQKDKLLNGEDLLLNLLTDLDHFYFQEKLILTAEIKSRAAFLKHKIKIPLLAEIKGIVAQNPKNHLLYTYFLLLEMFDQQNEISYQQLKNYFRPTYQHLPYKLSITVFRILTNYCGRQINNGNEAFYSEQFKLYQFGVETQLIVYNQVISAPTFINIVFVAIYINQKEWAIKFIKDYQTFLPAGIQVEVLQITSALIAYFDKNFNSTISILHSFKSNNLSRMFTVKKLLIRSYFELFLTDFDYYDLFLSSCLSFEKYLRRNNQNNLERIQANLNFTYYLKKIGKAIVEREFKAEKKKILLAEIKKNPTLILKYWLVKKLEL